MSFYSKPQIDSYAKTSVFNESTYNPDSVSNGWLFYL